MSWADAVADSLKPPEPPPPLAFGKPDKWSVRLACGTPERHYVVLGKLKDDGIEWCPQCRKFRPRIDVAPYSGGRRRKRSKPDADTPTLFDGDPPCPF